MSTTNQANPSQKQARDPSAYKFIGGAYIHVFVMRAGARVIVVQGAISGAAKASVTSDKTIVGKFGSPLTGVGLTILGQKNVTIRNLKVSEVLAAYGDAVTINESTNIWVDDCGL